MYAIIDWSKVRDTYSKRYSVMPLSAIDKGDEKGIINTFSTYIEAQVNLETLGKEKSNPRRTRKDMGRPGKTPESKKWAEFRPGSLKRWTKHKDFSTRFAELKEAVSEFGYTKTIRNLNQLANVSTDVPTIKTARHDMLALVKKYRPDHYLQVGKEFRKKTRQMLKGRGRKLTGRTNPVGSGRIEVVLPDGLNTISELAEAVQKATGWGMAHCRRQARKIIGKIKKKVK